MNTGSLLRSKAIALALIMTLSQTPFGVSEAHAQGAAPQVTEAHYRIFRSDGTAATLDDVIAAMADANAVFIGESHDDPAAHFLEAELLRRAYERFGRASGDARRRREVTLSLEMFERDVQLVLDEYLAGVITEQHFLTSSRAWSNYRTDYRPMVELARENRLAVIAANAPRRYVNRVARMGRASLDALSTDARRSLAPLPYGEPSPAYAAKFMRLMGGAPVGQPHAPTPAPAQTQPSARTQTAPPTQTQPQPHVPAPSALPAPGPSAPHGASLLEAQALWDATMAYAIAEHLRQRPQALVLHVNGRFHSEERLGAPEHLLRYVAGARFLVISIVPGEGFPAFDAARVGRLGDFVILTDPSLPRSR